MIERLASEPLVIVVTFAIGIGVPWWVARPARHRRSSW